MKKTMFRKVISVFLSILMTASLFAGLSANAFAMQVFVRTPTGRHITFDFEPSDLIEDVKLAIEAQEGIPAADQILVYAEKTLENGYTLQDYSVQPDSTLRLNLLYNEWTTSDALPSEAGFYKLMTDVMLSRTWSPADGTTLDLNGHKITRSGSINHFISVENGVTFTLDDSRKNSTDPADRHYYSGSAPVSISDSGSGDSFVGGYLTGISSYADPGGAIIVQPGGNCIMNGGNIVGNRNGSNAGGVMVRGSDENAGLPGGVFTLNGGNIIGNSASWGGGVYTQGGSTFNLVSGSIASNYAMNGGGGVLTWGTFNMSGGVVSKNTSIGPAGFYLFEGEFHLSGGTITQNASSRDQGGLGGAAKTYLSGNPVVIGNTSRGNTSNFNVPNGKTLTLEGALTEGASIAINMSASPANGEPLPITSGWSEFMGTAAPDDYFAYDNASLPIILSASGEIQAVDPSKTYYNAIFAAGEGSGTMAGTTTAAAMTLPESGFTAPEGQIFYAWLSGADGELYQPGTVFTMTQDVTFTAQWVDAVYVVFDTQGGSPVATQALVPGATATKPTDPEKEGMVLTGWRLNGAFFDFGTPVTADIVLHAVWAESTTGYNPAGTVNTYEDFEALTGSSGYNTAENYPSLVDGNIQTKWCGPAPSGFIEFYCEELIVPTGYILTTANDTNSNPGRNPKNWTIQAKLNADDAWTTIASVENDTTLQGVSFVDFAFTIDGCTEWYRYFRFAYSAVRSGDTFQLSELRLKGIPAIMPVDHDLTIGAADNVLTATCANDPCAWDTHTLTLTLNAPAHTGYGDGANPAATLTDLGRFNVELDLSISEDDIEYYKGETLLAAAPTDAGDYTASLTTVINGSTCTITKDYTIAKAAPEYTVPADLSAGYGQQLREIALPSGWAWDGPDTNVGAVGTKTFPATYTPADTINYNLIHENLSVTVDPKELIVAADAQSKTYGDADPALTYTASGFEGDDGYEVFTGALVCAEGVNVGEYAITQGTLSAGNNYTISFTGANLTVTARPLTVTAEAKTKARLAEDPALTYTTEGLVDGDTVTVNLSRAPGETVGEYNISADIDAGSNYAVTYVGAKLTILPNDDDNAAAAVAELIAAIGDVTYTEESKARIDAAKEAYEALTDEQKAILGADAAATLSAARTTYDTLKAEAEPSVPTDGEKIHGEHCFCYNVSADSTIGSLIRFLCGIICALIQFLSTLGVA